MYYKIYNIPNSDDYKNINILRFSYNKFYDTTNEPDVEEKEKISSFLKRIKRTSNF
jgi:hypothetical protein